MALLTRSQYLAALAPLSAAPSNNWCCPICLESEAESAPVFAHNGLHLYHSSCLATWVKESSSSTCPDCREQLFRGDPIPTTGPLTPQRGIEWDAQHLHQIWGWDQYTELIRAEGLGQDDADLVAGALHNNLARLHRRWNLYTRGDLVMNVAYPDDVRSLESHNNFVDGSDEETDAETVINSPRLITALFATYWDAFSRRQATPVHHPLFTGLLLHTIGSIKRWNGWKKTGNDLKILLQINLGRGFDTIYPVEQLMRPQGWERYKVEMIEFLANVLEEERHLGEFVTSALQWQDYHAELWRN